MLSKLNPLIRSAATYEVINRHDECIAYDSRVFYMISGDVAITIGNEKKSHLTAGNLIYIPAGVSYKIKGQYLRMVAITFDLTDERSHVVEKIVPSDKSSFDPSKMPRDTVPPFDKVIRVDDMESERDTFTKISDIATSAEGEWRAQISAILKLILLRINETVSENALPSRMVEYLDSYIRENCSEEISNTEIGAIFGYHPFYVSTMLKEKKGQTLRQYIISYRLKAAKRLLEHTGKSIAEIADETGFTDASYFTKTFRSAFGMTPKEYRNSTKEDFI